LTALHRSRRARRALLGTRDYRCKELYVCRCVVRGCGGIGPP